MDPQTQRLAAGPRVLNTDAFFTNDRSPTPVQRTATVIQLDANGRDDPSVAAVPTVFHGFQSKHKVDHFTAPNPVPHQRMTDPDPKRGTLDPAVRTFTHEADYICFLSAEARALSVSDLLEKRLRVKLLFGTGSEAFRHGVCGAVEPSREPTLLIIVSGIEPEHNVTFTDPTNPTHSTTLRANNRWGVGITRSTIENAIERHFGRVINHDVTVAAAFSTGYLGLQESIARSLVPLDRLERIIIFDCLYGTLKPALDRVKALKGDTHIICYIVSEGGNSFHKDAAKKSFDTLLLGKVPTWRYVNLFGNVGFHAIASARIVKEARTGPAPIITALPATYEAALDALHAVLPGRNAIISDQRAFTAAKGGPPTGTTTLNAFMSNQTNASLVHSFFKQAEVTRHCIQRAQLLGWPAPPGEEWHDMILVEFGWEYLQ